jgi:hypothetical protein
MNIWSKTKRNHALEHGTISLLLNGLTHHQPMAGYSVPGGFFVLGNVTTEQVDECSREALSRMQKGEADLAVSPFCGTNIVVTAMLTSLGSLAGYKLGGRGLRGLNRAFSNAALAIVAGQPIGRAVQRRYTTSADVGAMRIGGISRLKLGKLTVHWVATGFEA